VLVRLPRTLWKRRRIQRTRKVMDREFFISGPIYLSPALLRLKFVRAAFYVMNGFFDAYWRAVKASL